MIFQYRATIPASRFFYREYELRGTSSLYKVMEFIQTQMNFAPDMMILFQGLDEKGAVLHEYGLFDMGDGSIDHVTVEEAYKNGDVTLRFIYNISGNLYMDLKFTGTAEADPRTEYPHLAGEKGHAPQQFSGVYVEDINADRPHGLPHPVEGDDDIDDDEDDDDDDEEDGGFEEEELPEGKG